MKRYAIAIALLIAAAILGVVWHLSRRSPPAPEPPLDALAYAEPNSWAVWPDPLPPPVWDGGWAIDVFLVTKAAMLSGGPVENRAMAAERARAASARLADSFASVGAAFAPFLRKDMAASDIMVAFETYLSSANGGRAFVIVTDQPLPLQLADILEGADPLLRDRFGGILVLGGGDNPQAEVFAGLPEGTVFCSRRFAPGESCVESLTASGRPRNGEGSGRIIGGLTDWLEREAARPAEPLGELENIEIREIKRPEETP